MSEPHDMVEPEVQELLKAAYPNDQPVRYILTTLDTTNGDIEITSNVHEDDLLKMLKGVVFRMES